MPVTRRHRTVLAIAAVAFAVLILLALEIAGVASLSLGGNAIYNPMPGYGPLRTPSVSCARPATGASTSARLSAAHAR